MGRWYNDGYLTAWLAAADGVRGSIAIPPAPTDDEDQRRSWYDGTVDALADRRRWLARGWPLARPAVRVI